MEILIYALPKGESRDYMEDLLSSHCHNQADVNRVIKAATTDGWHSFRVTQYNGEAPDFTKCVL